MCEMAEGHSSAIFVLALVFLRIRPNLKAMIFDLPHLLIAIAILLAIYFVGPKLWARLKAFDDDNAKRRAQEMQDRRDGNAHYRHAIETAAEQVEDVTSYEGRDSRTGLPITLYLFEGESFGTRTAAEEVRAKRIYEKARGFYTDLPVALTERRRENLK